jgi:hypothetical protein
MKNRVNKQIIKALSVGLAASMALQPVTAFAETPEGDTTNTGAATTTPTPAQTAEAEAQTATTAANTASDALTSTASVQTSENKSVESAKEATQTEKDNVSEILENLKLPVGADSLNPLGGADFYYDEAIKNIDGEDEDGNKTGADASVKEAISEIDKAKAANEKVDNYNKALDDIGAATQELNDALDAGKVTEIDKEFINGNVSDFGNAPVVPKEGEDKEAVEGAGAIGDAVAAKDDYNSAEELANKAINGVKGEDGNSTGGYVDVDKAIADYISSGAAADVSGEELEKIKKAAETCDKDLDDAKELYEQAEGNLKDAQNKCTLANNALEAARDEYNGALAAYKKLVGDDEEKIVGADLTAEDRAAFATAKRKAKEALEKAQGELATAENNLKAAESEVTTKLNDLHLAEYQNLVALQAAIDKAEDVTGEDGKNPKLEATKAFKEALIKFYYLGNGAKDKDVAFGSVDFTSDEYKDVITIVDGKASYISGYDNDGNPITTELPADSVYTATYTITVKNSENGEDEQVVTKYYRFAESEDGIYSITEIPELAVGTKTVTETTKDSYVYSYKNDQNETVKVTKTVDEMEAERDQKAFIDENGAAGVHVGDRTTVVYDDFEITDQVPQGYKKYSWKNSVGDTRYTKISGGTEKESEYGTITVTEEIPGEFETRETPETKYSGYSDWEATKKTYSGNKNYQEWIYDLNKLDYIPMSDADEWLIESITRMVMRGLLLIAPYKVTYTKVEPTDIPKTQEVEKSGFVVETYDTYICEKYEKRGGETSDYKDSEGNDLFSGNLANSIVQNLRNQGNKADKVYWGKINGTKYYTVQYTTPVTYGWYEVPKSEKKVTTNKVMYGSNDYMFVEGGSNDVNKSYLAYNVAQSSSNLNSNTEKQEWNSIIGAYEEAKENFDNSKASYDNAKDRLEKAQTALNNMNPLDPETAQKRKDIVDTYQAAKLAFENAELKKLEAESALNDAREARDNAFAKIQEAKNKQSATYDGIRTAEAAKKAADDARNTPTGGGDDTTTGGGDDTTTGGGEGTTTFIPVAVTPATNVVAPAADNAQAPAVLGARTTRKTTTKSAADTDTVATDNSNGNGGNDNSAVAGAQKEETKTPEAPKEETKIDDGDVALQATPELEEGSFAWWWLLILAALAGVSVEEYVRRKSNKAKAEAKDSTKINK